MFENLSDHARESRVRRLCKHYGWRLCTCRYGSNAILNLGRYYILDAQGIPVETYVDLADFLTEMLDLEQKQKQAAMA